MYTYTIINLLEMNHKFDSSLDIRPLIVSTRIMEQVGEAQGFHGFAKWSLFFSFCPLRQGTGMWSKWQYYFPTTMTDFIGLSVITFGGHRMMV